MREVKRSRWEKAKREGRVEAETDESRNGVVDVRWANGKRETVRVVEN